MTDEPGFAALETTIATALHAARHDWADNWPDEDFDTWVARVVCEAITTQSRWAAFTDVELGAFLRGLAYVEHSASGELRKGIIDYLTPKAGRGESNTTP